MKVNSIRLGILLALIVSFPVFFLGSPEVNASSPLAVSLQSFTATGDSRGVVLEWTTETEEGTAGYYIKRANSRDDFTEIIDVNWDDDVIEFYEPGGSPDDLTDFIPGRGFLGASYVVIDPNVEVGVTYWYQLVEQENSGHVQGASDLYDEYTKSAVAGYTPTPTPNSSGGAGSGFGFSTPTPIPTQADDSTNTPTPTSTAISTPTPTLTPTPTTQATSTSGNSGSADPTVTNTPQPTATPQPTSTSTSEPTNTPEDSKEEETSEESNDENTPTPPPTTTPTEIPTAEPTQTPPPTDIPQSSESENTSESGSLTQPTNTPIPTPTEASSSLSTAGQPTDQPTPDGESNSGEAQQEIKPTATANSLSNPQNGNSQELGAPQSYPVPDDDRSGSESNTIGSVSELNPAAAQSGQGIDNSEVETNNSSQSQESGQAIAVAQPSNEDDSESILQSENTSAVAEPSSASQSLGSGSDAGSIGTLLTEAESNDRSIGTLGGNSNGQLAPPPIIQDQPGAINNMVLWLAFIGSLLVFGAGVMAAILIFSRRRSDK